MNCNCGNLDLSVSMIPISLHSILEGILEEDSDTIEGEDFKSYIGDTVLDLPEKKDYFPPQITRNKSVIVDARKLVRCKQEIKNGVQKKNGVQVKYDIESKNERKDNVENTKFKFETDVVNENVYKPSQVLSSILVQGKRIQIRRISDNRRRVQYRLPKSPKVDANDNRPRGGGKLLGTGGGKLLRSEGGKLDELGELDGGGEKMMVYEDITSLCLPDVQSSSPDPSDPCSSTSYTVQGKEDVPKRFCLVCGDTASGFHYGVSSCEACKAFFKRTIQGNIDYSCPASGDCEINKRRRKACQACRYQKCIRKGMLKEGVRLDRVRGGRQKYRRLTEGTVYGEINSTRRVSLEDNYMLECLTISEPDPISILDCEPCTKLGELRTAAVLADVYDRELVLTIGWAKQVPGFSELSLNDQMKMLQCSWTEVLTLTLVYRSLPKLGLLNFATDFSLTKAEAEQVGLLQFFQKCMLIIEKMASLTLYREEYLILKSLVLVNSDCSIEMKDRVEGIKESVISSLQDCSSVLRCVDPSLAVNQLLLLLPSLREADNLLRIFWLKIRKEGRVQMNRLLVEMLES